MLAVNLVDRSREGLDRADVPAGDAVLLGQLQEPHGPRVIRFVLRVSKPRQRLLIRPVLLSDVPSFRLRPILRLQHLLQQRSAPFHRAHKETPDAQQPRCNGPLHGFGRARVGEAGSQGARAQAMLHQRDQAGVEHGGLSVSRQAAKEVKVDHLREAQLANDLFTEALVTDEDVLSGAERNTRGLGFRKKAHGCLLFR